VPCINIIDHWLYSIYVKINKYPKREKGGQQCSTCLTCSRTVCISVYKEGARKAVYFNGMSMANSYFASNVANKLISLLKTLKSLVYSLFLGKYGHPNSPYSLSSGIVLIYTVIFVFHCVTRFSTLGVIIKQHP
jgi:hypothetical protein